jgi:hypothetical protein
MNLAPLSGTAIGILLILFRDRVCLFLENVYEKFPKYEDGVKMLNLKFSVRPIFVIVFAILIILFSLTGFIVSL